MVLVKKKKQLKNVTVSTSKANFDVEIYNDVARSAELIRLISVSSGFSVREDCLSQIAKNTPDCKFYYEGAVTECFFNSERGIIVGKYGWKAEIKIGRKKALKCDALFLIAYANLEDKEERYVKFFFNKLSRFASFPYFRAHFSAQSSSAGLALDPLPSLTERVD